MSQKETSETYPLRSLHDFLTELDKEWSKFRTSALIGIVISGLLFVFFVLRFLNLLVRIRNLGLRFLEIFDELIFLILISAFVFYEIYLLYRQHRFFTKWERRIGLLQHLEERLMEEASEKIDKKNDSS